MLVADSENNRVGMLHKDFKFVRHLVTEVLHDITRPRDVMMSCLALDPVNGILYVGQTNSVIHVISVAYSSMKLLDGHLPDPLTNCYSLESE